MVFQISLEKKIWSQLDIIDNYFIIEVFMEDW